MSRFLLGSVFALLAACRHENKVDPLDPDEEPDDTGDTNDPDDTGDTGGLDCPDGTVSFETEAGTEDLTALFLTGTAESPLDWALEEPGTLRLCAGTWYARIDVAADGAVEGEDPETTELSAGGSGTVIDVGAFAAAVRGVAVTGGGEGGIRAEGAALALQDVDIRSNAAPGNGAGLYVLGGTADLSHVSVSLNDAGGFGGGIYAEGAVVSMESVGLTANAAAEEGGGLAMEGGVLALSAATIADNSADGCGGGLFLAGGAAADISGVSIQGNDAGDGGGLCASSSDVMMLEITVQDNTALVAGGIILLGGSLSFSTGDLSGNAAGTAAGGLLVLSDGEAELEAMSLSANTASEGGGAMVTSGGYLHVHDASVQDNAADTGAGILARDGGEVALQGMTLSGNDAAGDGGGLYLDGAAAELANVDVSGNTAARGGGVAWTGSELDESGVSWTDNLPEDAYDLDAGEGYDW